MLSALQPRIRIVQSPSNQWVKALRHAVAHPPALVSSSSSRDMEQPAGDQPLVALEGPNLVAEALAAGLVPRALFLRQSEPGATMDALTRLLDEATRQAIVALPAETAILALSPALFRNLAGTEAPQPIAALIPAPQASPDVTLSTGPALLAVLCGVQDPGNVGTLLRSALAFGATGAVFLPGCASPWNGKALRASAGAALRLPLLALRDAAEAAGLLRARGIRSYAAVPAGGLPAEEHPLAGPAALWIGNEGAGLTADEQAACDARITLPMVQRSESLNAAVAGSLLLYEAARRRAASKQL